MSIPGPYNSKQVAELAPGSKFWGKFMVSEKNQRKTRTGGELTTLRLVDQTGSLEAVVWDNCQLQGDLSKGAVIAMQADTSLYYNRRQITARRIKIFDEDPTPYMPSAPVPRDALVAELHLLTESLADQHLSALMNTILTPECVSQMSITPAAKRIHHNYLGGLLEHTLAVARLCEQASQQYHDINRDLLIAGAILHDIGKIKEFETQVTPEYTVSGKLLGHIVMGCEMVDQAIAQLRRQGHDFPAMLENMIKHLILSHHGSLEFGSPVKPLFPEAFLLHVMDNLDAKMFVYFEKMTLSENAEQYVTPYDSFHQQQFFTYRYQGAEGQEGE